MDPDAILKRERGRPYLDVSCLLDMFFCSVFTVPRITCVVIFKSRFHGDAGRRHGNGLAVGLDVSTRSPRAFGSTCRYAIIMRRHKNANKRRLRMPEWQPPRITHSAAVRPVHGGFPLLTRGSTCCSLSVHLTLCN